MEKFTLWERQQQQMTFITLNDNCFFSPPLFNANTLG